VNRLVVLAGPSGVGKGTVVRALRERHPEVWLSVSATTRNPRPGEVDGEHYFFVSDDEFTRMIEAGELLEWATVFGGNRYGTPRGPVLDRLATDTPCILEIDLQGARQVRESMPEALQVFIAPPSYDALVDRLTGRGTEDERERESRLKTAREELAAQGEFDEVITNDSVADAALALERLVLSSR